MVFDVITLFPELFEGFLKESIIGRAQKKGLLRIRVHNLRRWTKDAHKTVDDKPYGGGIGMVMKVEPIYRAVQSLKPQTQDPKFKINSRFKIQNSRIILFTPRGKKFDQKMAYRFSKLDQIIMICGRYEGVDERVAKYIAHEKISIGDYVLMGGDVPAMVVIEAVARLLPGVLGKPQLLKERITRRGGFIEYPEYTRPEVFAPLPGRQWRVPKILLSGNHKKILEWKKRHGRII